MTRAEMRQKIMEQTRRNGRVQMCIDSAECQIKDAKKQKAHNVWVTVLEDTKEEVKRNLCAKGYTVCDAEDGLSIWF